MNKSIKELSFQSANEIADLFSSGFFNDRMINDIAKINEKFAELLLKDVIQVLVDHGYPNAFGECVGVIPIKKHFKIDEYSS
jgi:hypothetical protein